MGGLWVDYNLMSNVPGLFVIGEANFSDHGANRLGASALMQGLADGYFILALHDRQLLLTVALNHAMRRRRISRRPKPRRGPASNRSASGSGKRTATSFHRELGD